MARSSGYDPDLDALISHFACGLAPSDRDDFRSAAVAAIEQLPYSGPGILHRTLREVWRGYFRAPPDDTRREGARHLPRRSEDAAPIEDDSARGRSSARARWMRGWRG